MSEEEKAAVKWPVEQYSTLVTADEQFWGRIGADEGGN